MRGDAQFDFTATMERVPIPQQAHWSPKMPEQVLEERANIQPCEIVGPKREIEGQPFPFGRHGQRTDR